MSHDALCYAIGGSSDYHTFSCCRQNGGIWKPRKGATPAEIEMSLQYCKRASIKTVFDVGAIKKGIVTSGTCPDSWWVRKTTPAPSKSFERIALPHPRDPYDLMVGWW